MSSRDTILAAVKAAQPTFIPLQEPVIGTTSVGDVQKFAAVLESIGGQVFSINDIEEVLPAVEKIFPSVNRIISAISSLNRFNFVEDKSVRHHTFHDADVIILEAQLAVAENGAVWLTEDNYKLRVLPFIGEHLVMVVQASSIVANMHQAYELIANADYGFGVFVAGPSKTADIEQSLVLGAHGPKTMTVFVIG
jgi:L-lactate dehydrogenase complex protein LldG